MCMICVINNITGVMNAYMINVIFNSKINQQNIKTSNVKLILFIKFINFIIKYYNHYNNEYILYIIIILD